MDHIQQFQQVIAEQQRQRLLAQQASPFVPVRPKATAPTPESHCKPIGRPSTARDINAYANAKALALQSQHVQKHFSDDDYFRFNYVAPIIDNVICFVVDNIVHSLVESNLQGPGTSRIIRELHENSTYLYNRYLRERSEFIDGIQYLRYQWYDRYGLGLHIKNVQRAYLNEIINSEHAYRDTNANDLLAWCYTIVALGFDQFTFLTDMSNKFNANVSKREQIVIHPFRQQDCYDTIKSVQRFIKLCKFPHAFASEQIAKARDVMVNQMKLAPIYKIYQEAMRIKEMEGKTTQIA